MKVKHVIYPVLLFFLTSPVVLAQPLLERIQLLKDMWRYDEMVKLLKIELSSDSTNVALKVELADCLVQLDQNDSALKIYRELENVEPYNISYKLKQMATLYRTNNYKECIAQGQQIIQIDTIPRVLSLMGDAFVKIKKWNSAIYCYEKVLRYQPCNWRVLDKVSDIYLRVKNHDAVLLLTQKYLQMEPNNSNVRQIQGLVYYLQGKYYESLSDFLLLLNSGVDTDVVHYYIGLNSYCQKDYGGALKEFELLYPHKDTDVNLIIYLADSRSKTGYDYETEVKPMFEKAISLMQPNSEKMFSIFSKYGYSSLNNHYYMDAISAYQKAYQCDSTYTDALLFIAYSYEKLNNYTSSLSFYNQFLAKEDKLSEEKRDYVQSRIYHVKEEIFMAEN